LDTGDLPIIFAKWVVLPAQPLNKYIADTFGYCKNVLAIFGASNMLIVVAK